MVWLRRSEKAKDNGECVGASIEFVLPSGRFATMRPLKWSDLVCAYNENAMVMITLLMARTVKIDGKEVSCLEFMDMDAEEVNVIANIVSSKTKEILKLQKGIA
jgi:hypothetical protein